MPTLAKDCWDKTIEFAYICVRQYATSHTEIRDHLIYSKPNSDEEGTTTRDPIDYFIEDKVSEFLGNEEFIRNILNFEWNWLADRPPAKTAYFKYIKIAVKQFFSRQIIRERPSGRRLWEGLVKLLRDFEKKGMVELTRDRHNIVQFFISRQNRNKSNVILREELAGQVGDIITELNNPRKPLVIITKKNDPDFGVVNIPAFQWKQINLLIEGILSNSNGWTKITDLQMVILDLYSVAKDAAFYSIDNTSAAQLKGETNRIGNEKNLVEMINQLDEEDYIAKLNKDDMKDQLRKAQEKVLSGLSDKRKKIAVLLFRNPYIKGNVIAQKLREEGITKGLDEGNMSKDRKHILQELKKALKQME